MQNAKLLLIDADTYTADVLMEDLEDRGYANVTRIENSLLFPANIASDEFDLVIFNYHFHDASALLNCNAIKSILPKQALLSSMSETGLKRPGLSMLLLKSLYLMSDSF
jgi:DNA-binding response OmpR family regulator